MNAMSKDNGQKALIIPTVVLLLVYYGLFFVFPVFFALFGSFCKWNPLVNEIKFVGLDNYSRIFSSPEVFISLKNTVVYSLVVVVFRVFLGLLLANGIESMRSFKSFLRTVLFLPVVTSIIAVSLLFTLIYEPTSGLLNTVLSTAGMPKLGWLKDSSLALPSIMLMTLWKDTGFAMVLYLAGLNAIPSSYYEAADIDGGTELQKFLYIKIPLLSNVTLFVVITGIIGYLQVFSPIFMMTEGGPGSATTSVVYLIYKEAFNNYNFGYASVITFLLFLMILVLSVLQLKLIKTQEVS